MRRSAIHLCLLVLFSTTAGAVTRWQTVHDGFSSGPCQLESDTLRVTVHSFHADVEEEAVIAARGSVSWGNPRTLEIVGEFSLSEGTTLRSMLLWNGDIILKAKLRDRAAADSAYEEVVQRQKPQVIVRDPALIEYLGNNTYRFKIYPVEINASRKIRILYSIPLQIVNGEPTFSLKPAFTIGADQSPGQIPVEIRKSGTDARSCLLHCGGIRRTIQFGSVYQINHESFYTRQYSWSAPVPAAIQIIPDTSTFRASYTSRCGEQGTSGYYSAIFTRIPAQIGQAIAQLRRGGVQTPTVEASIVAGERGYIADNLQGAFLAAYVKSPLPWDSTVLWRVYDSKGNVAAAVSEQLYPKSNPAIDSVLPLLWAAKYCLTKNQGSLGALYGFIDRQMSLLALESDSLKHSESSQWIESGVPLLLPHEIELNPDQLPRAPRENVIYEFGTRAFASPDAVRYTLRINLTRDGALFIDLGTGESTMARIVLMDLSGRVLKTWDGMRITGGSLQLTLPGLRTGMYLVQIETGSYVIRRKVNLR